MLTAHKQLGAVIGTYRAGWVILNDASEIVATVKTKAEAERIVKDQRLR